MTLLRLMTCNDHLTSTGVDQPTQHFQGGGFPGAIGTKKSHHLSRSNAETDVAHGLDVTVMPAHEALQGSTQTRLLVSNSVSLTEALNLDHKRTINNSWVIRTL